MFSGLNKFVRSMVGGRPTPLQQAAKSGDVARVKQLVAQGAIVNELSDEEPTALGQAASLGHLDVVRALIDLGADVNVGSRTLSPLRLALNAGGQGAIVRLLIEHGASLGENSPSDALSDAALNGDSELFDILLAKGLTYATPNSATKRLHRGPQTFYLNRGLGIEDVNAMDEDWQTPLHHVRTAADVRALHKHGANLNALNREGKHFFTVAMTRFMAQDPNSAKATALKEILSTLLELGVDVNQRDGAGWIPMHHAAAGGHVPSMELLFEHGSAINVADDTEGQTPLHLAGALSDTKGERAKTVSWLLQHSADAQIKNKKQELPCIPAACRQGR